MPTLQDKEDSLMKLNSKRIDFEYTPGEEIFTFPEDTGLPFFFDVDEELTDNPSAMDAVGEMLDEAETLAEKAKAAIKSGAGGREQPLPRPRDLFHAVPPGRRRPGYCG